MPTNRYSQEGQEQPQQKEGKNQTRQVYARFLFLDCIKCILLHVMHGVSENQTTVNYHRATMSCCDKNAILMKKTNAAAM